MALTTAQQVRLKIQDQPLRADEVYDGDGKASAFGLPHANVAHGTALVLDTAGKWSATGATFNASGTVTFSGVITANTGFRVIYEYSTFSDDEIGHFTAVGGNVLGAAVEACEALMLDSLKRARWASPDGTQYDDTQAMNAVVIIYEALKKQQADAAVLSGSVESWSLGQRNYS